MQEWLIVIFGYNRKRIWGNFSAYLVSDLYNPQLQWILLFFLPELYASTLTIERPENTLEAIILVKVAVLIETMHW